MDRVIFELDCIRTGGALRVSMAVKERGETVYRLERDYPPSWNAAEAATDLLRIYRDTPYTATRDE